MRSRSGSGGSTREAPAVEPPAAGADSAGQKNGQDELEKQQQQPQQHETNDKRDRESSRSARQASICQHQPEESSKQQQKAQESSGELAARRAPARQPRPLRPNLRRQVIVRGETSTSVPVLAGRPIELTSVLPAGAISLSGGPPKRPAHLPARYVLPTAQAAAVRMGPLPAQVGGAGSGSKPNRYAAWAQVQHWQAAVAQAQQQQGQQEGLPRQQQGFQHHFSSAASRVLVVNPMHIVNISKHTKSRLIKFIEAVKRFSEKWFSHVLLLLFLAVYACFGAYVFISFEAPTENWEKQFIIDTRLRIVNESWTEAVEGSGGREVFLEALRVKLEDYERLLNRACASGMGSNSLENQWTFWNALFFSMTVFTTIGYGHLTPITFAGRVATMVYAIFGIPILLMVLADLGKLLTRIIKYAFKKFRYLYNKLFKKNETSQRTRKLISDNTNQYLGFARRGFERGVATYIQPNYEKIPRAATLLRQRLWFSPKEPESAEVGGAPEVGEEDKRPNLTENLIPEADGSLGKKPSVSSEVIITPNRQTKPVSPQPGERRAEHPLSAGHHQHHNHAHNQHADAPARRSLERGQLKRKNSLAGSGSGVGGKSAGRNPKSSLSRSSSSSMLAPVGAQQVAGNLSEQRPDSAAPPEADPNNKQAAPVNSGASGDETFAGEILGEEIPPEEELSQEGDLMGEEEEEDFDIPVSFAVFLLIVYMMFGAVVFSIWEGWNFFDSLYFVFISMSTIGFGDLVPQHPKRMIGTFIYLLFGLALTSMCINVVQEKIHATFLRAKMQIGEKMGFDLDQIMADDYYGSMDANGCVDEDCESHSVAMSQTNSLLAQHPNHPNHPNHHEQQGGCEEPLERKLESAHSAEGLPAEGVRPSKSKESLKLKKRGMLASLPGHHQPAGSQTAGSSSSGAGASFRRKPSGKRPLSRQPTQSSAASSGPLPLPVVSSPKQLPPADLEAAGGGGQLICGKPIKSELEILRSGPQFVVLLNDPSAKLIPTNKPININVSGLCEPLTANPATGNRQARAQIVKSRSSESPLALASQPYRCDSSTSAATFRSSNLVAPRAPGSGSGRRSAGSSRRSSVSQELNQLDDLIMVLKSQAKGETRFGPLLGMSRSNSRH